MGLGLFRKKQFADTIYFGGTICTMDPAYPEAESVAVRDGVIIAVGEYEAIAEDLKGPDTRLVDLNGSFMTPGLIDLTADVTPVFLRELAKEIEAQQAEAAAAAENDGEAESEEDEEEETEPEAFDEDAYAMSELEPANAEIDASLRMFSERGVTTFLNLEHSGQGDDFFRNMLMARWQDGSLTHRYCGSVRFSRMIDINFLIYFLSGKKTLCNELDGYINSDFTDIAFSSDSENESYMDGEYLNAVSEQLAEHGFSVRYEALDEAASVLAESLCEDLGPAYKKVSFTVLKKTEYGSPEEKLEARTVYAASVLGMSRSIGSIEEGKRADFAVFEKDPRAVESKAYTILSDKEAVF